MKVLKDIAFYSLVIFALATIILDFLSAIKNTSLFLALAIIVMIVSVAMIINQKYSKKHLGVFPAILLIISGVMSILSGVNHIHYASLAFAIIMIVFSSVLTALAFIKMLLDAFPDNHFENNSNKKLNIDEITSILENIKSLHDKNILTDEEYEEQREKYVSYL